MPDAIVIIDGLATAYSQSGKGPDVLLLHGWGDSRKTFSGLTRSLEAKYRLTALDLPGFGGTEPPKKPWDLTDYSAFLAAFCKKLELKPKFIVGHSNGGALAIHALSLGKLSASKLVLLAPSGVRSPKRLKRAVIKGIAKTGKAATFWLPTTTKQKLQTVLYGTIGSDMLITPALKETFKRTVRQDIQSDAKKLQIPTLLIYGKDDKATPINEVGMVLKACIKGSIMEQVEAAGHFVHHDSPDRVHKLTRDFLA